MCVKNIAIEFSVKLNKTGKEKGNLLLLDSALLSSILKYNYNEFVLNWQLLGISYVQDLSKTYILLHYRKKN